MKNSQYVRRIRQAHRNPARFKKGITPVIIALIVAGVLGGGYLIVKQQESSWKTYTSDKYGFSFQYPKENLTPLEGTSSTNGRSVGQVVSTPISHNAMQGMVFVEVDNQNENNDVAPTCNNAISKERTTTSINGVDFLKYDVSRERKESGSNNAPNSSTEYCAMRNGIAYKIIIVAIVDSAGNPVDVAGNPKDVNKNAVLNKMVASFKFVDKDTLSEIPSLKEKKTSELSFALYHESKRCEGYVRRTNSDGQPAQFQTSAPRDGKSSIESGHDIGLRNKFGTSGDVYDYTVSIEQPDATVATAGGRVVGDAWSGARFPNNFVGSKAMEGVYKIFFKIENKVVACAEFKIVDSRNKDEQSAVSSDWKTYASSQFGFEIKYPANYFILDYGVTPKNTTFTAAVIAITDSKKTYESGGAKIVVYVSSLPVAAFKDSEEYLKYMRTSYPSLKNITVTMDSEIDLGGTEGIQFLGSQKDSAGKVENVQSILGYSNKTGYEVVAYSSDHPLFSDILSTFKITK